MERLWYSGFCRKNLKGSRKEDWRTGRRNIMRWLSLAGLLGLMAALWWIGLVGPEALLSLVFFGMVLGDDEPSSNRKPSEGEIFQIIGEIVKRLRDIEGLVGRGEADESELWQEWANLPTWLTEASPKVRKIVEDAQGLLQEAQFRLGSQPPLPQPRSFPNIGALLQWMTEMKLFFEAGRLSQESDAAVRRAQEEVPFPEIVQGEAIVDRRTWRLVGEIELPKPYGEGVPSELVMPVDPTDPFGRRPLWIKIPVEVHGMKGAPPLPLPGTE